MYFIQIDNVTEYLRFLIYLHSKISNYFNFDKYKLICRQNNKEESNEIQFSHCSSHQ